MPRSSHPPSAPCHASNLTSATDSPTTESEDEMRCLTTVSCNNGSAPAGATNTLRGLTRSSGTSREGLAMKATQVCSIEGCAKPARSKRIQLCSAHYARALRYGDPTFKPNRSQKRCDLTGKRFGMIEVIGDTSGGKWWCRCDCGTVWQVRTWCLTSGGTTKCNRREHKLSDLPISYEAAHKRIKKLRGVAKAHACVDCGSTAAHWSYTKNCPNEMLENGWAYSLDPSRYEPRCVPCHSSFDRKPAP